MSMMPIAATARMRGYRVINFRYCSTRATIAEHAAAFAEKVLPRIASAPRVHFITHSLGGIIVRHFLSTHSLPNLGRVVMLAPPNAGSEVADVLQQSLVISSAMMPLRELGTGATSVPRALPGADFEVGVIAGARSHIPLFSRWMDDVPNDGVVPVERTKLAGMKDFLVMQRTHTFLPVAPDAIGQAFRFIERGAFSAAS